MIGEKFDDGKVRWDLINLKVIEPFAKVLTFGAKKYEDDNWKKVDNAKKRYFAALLRHISAWQNGEITDPESNISHLAHAMCNIYFLMYFDENVPESVPDERAGDVGVEHR